MRLRRTKDLWQYTIAAIDTDIGRVHDIYFDDETWTIRYIVVATGVLMARREVLISPTALRPRAWAPLHICANLSWQQVLTSPSIDLHKPISRQHEIEHHDHYGLLYYWRGKGLWGAHSHPAALAKAGKTGSNPKSVIENPSPDAHLRSVRNIAGYHVSAIGGEIGHVEDFLFDDKTWEIRYVIVDTRNWWPGKRVLIHPEWIDRVSWKNRKIYVKLSREVIGNSPKWDSRQPISRKYELQLHQHYGCPPYWETLK
ncbi:MAG TPA: PRC-barrel domain-containing protein [Candidatus Acidoferrum sp.]|nr:PRC-barrel domain-containing protein [Candidatus Acidoferrum sp.]